MLAILCTTFVLYPELSIAQTVSGKYGGLTQAQYEKVMAGDATWRRQEGAGLETTLSLLNGTCRLRIEVAGDLTNETVQQRKLAALLGLAYLFDSAPLSSVTLVLGDHGLRRPSGRMKQVLEVTRLQFTSIIALVPGANSSKDAARVGRTDPAKLNAMCARLGIQ